MIIKHKVFTDGSTYGNCRKNKYAKGGIGVYFGKNDKRNLGVPFLLEPITNNRCEIFAVIRAIEQFINSIDLKRKYELKIYSDSMYVINSITKWIYKWHKNNWKTIQGKPVKNKDLLEWLYKLMKIYETNIKYEFEHVKAHTIEIKNYKSYGNMMADKLAKKGMKLSC